LFDHPAEPIRLRHDRVEYLVQPSRSVIAERRHAEVYSVDRVFGVARTEELETREFQPFYSFSHTMDADPRGATYFQTHLRPNIQGGDARLGTDTYISFVVSGQAGRLPPEESISMDLTCTNRNLPDVLRAGDITEPLDKSPPGVAFRNLTKPTSTICPPLGKQLHWRLISHMSLNYVSLTNAELFKELLRVYDFQGEHDAQKAMAHARMLNGIQSIRSAPAERLVHGAPIRGTRVELELNEDHFAGEGDAYLFSTILDRFMALYATLNAYTQLQVRFTKSGREYFFAPRWGEQPVPAETRAS
jgi:type VI secretion system protein ImpG